MNMAIMPIALSLKDVNHKGTVLKKLLSKLSDFVRQVCKAGAAERL